MTDTFADHIADSNTRRLYVKQAEAWLARQTRRLEVSREDILAAIRRGWLASEIEQVRSAAELVRRRR